MRNEFIDDIITDACDYIGNKPEQFAASKNDINTIRENFDFRKHLTESIDNEEYTENQTKNAETVWKVYRLWKHDND